MILTELQAQIALGEDSRRQFKRDVTNADSLAAEMAAFANSEGGAIFLGVADDGPFRGLSRPDAQLIFQTGSVFEDRVGLGQRITDANSDSL